MHFICIHSSHWVQTEFNWLCNTEIMVLQLNKDLHVFTFHVDNMHHDKWETFNPSSHPRTFTTVWTPEYHRVQIFFWSVFPVVSSLIIISHPVPCHVLVLHAFHISPSFVLIHQRLSNRWAFDSSRCQRNLEITAKLWPNGWQLHPPPYSRGLNCNLSK